MKRQVLSAFKRLHRARQQVFQGDQRALYEGRKQINEHFQKNKSETNPIEIKKMVQLAYDVEKELRTNVIQAVEKKAGVYELHIREETTKLDNIEFDPYAEIPPPRARRQRNTDKTTTTDCCGGGAVEKN